MARESETQTMFELYKSASMELALQLEEQFSDAELGLVAQSDDRRGYETINY